MFRMRFVAATTTATMLAGTTAIGATDAKPGPTDPPLGPPLVYDDPVGGFEAGVAGLHLPWCQ